MVWQRDVQLRHRNGTRHSNRRDDLVVDPQHEASALPLVGRLSGGPQKRRRALSVENYLDGSTAVRSGRGRGDPNPGELGWGDDDVLVADCLALGHGARRARL